MSPEDRVLAAAPTDLPVDPPPPTGPGVPPANASASPALIAVLDLEPGARWLLDVHGAIPVEAAPAGPTRVELPVLSVDWGVRLVMSLHGQARVVAPGELVDAVARTAEAGRAAYP